MAPERIADLVEEMSDGQMTITVYGAEEQVPAFGVFDAVSSGSHQMGHSGGYFWKEKFPLPNFLLVFPLVLQQMKLMPGLIGWRIRAMERDLRTF